MDNKVGVYSITNTVTNKRYIGSSRNIKVRFYSHQTTLNRNGHHAKELQKDWNKYGEEKFLFEFLEECDPKEIIEKEEFYINKYDTLNKEFGYNSIKPIDNSFKGEKIKRVNFSTTLNEQLIRKIKMTAIDTGKNSNDIIEDALRAYFEGVSSNEGKDTKRENKNTKR